eukprot:COSAG06_NODE_4086_length_4588_cov_57.562932_2_plen_519_part_00
MAGWSKNTQIELRTLLRALGQPIDGGKAALVQRLTAFLGGSEATTGDERAERGSGPSASEATELEAAGADRELSVWRDAVDRLDKATTFLVQTQATETQARTAAAQARAERAQQKAAAEAAATAAHVVLHPCRVRHNEQTCQLLQLVGQDDLRPTFLRAEVWGVLGLWRLRGVCRAFRGWAQAVLSSLPRVVAVSGMAFDRSFAPPKWVATASVESLDLSTMRWSAAGCMPSLPDPRAFHSVSCSADGRVMVCGGYNHGGADLMFHLERTALQWLPGTSAWSALPDLPVARECAASVRLPDGRTMLIGAWSDNDDYSLASVLVLAADGSGWSDLPPLLRGRAHPAAALLPDGKVLVAGGRGPSKYDDADYDHGDDDGDDDDSEYLEYLSSAELWNPATQKWTALPPMVHGRSSAAACVLPNGRVAVVGGAGTHGVARRDGEVYDPVKGEWEPLGAEMANKHGDPSAVAVAGGLLKTGAKVSELYDEGSGRWLKLPHAMVQPRNGAGLVSVPVAALTVS